MAITTNFHNFSFNNPPQTLDSRVKGRILPNPHERIIKTKIPKQLKVHPNNALVHSMAGTTEKNRSGPQRLKFPPGCPNWSLCPNDFSLESTPRPRSVRATYALTGWTKISGILTQPERCCSTNEPLSRGGNWYAEILHCDEYSIDSSLFCASTRPNHPFDFSFASAQDKP